MLPATVVCELQVAKRTEFVKQRKRLEHDSRHAAGCDFAVDQDLSFNQNALADISNDARDRSQQKGLAHATGTYDQGDFTGLKIGMCFLDQLFVAGHDVDISQRNSRS